jgi:hypothetical protein
MHGDVEQECLYQTVNFIILGVEVSLPGRGQTSYIVISVYE